MMTNSTIQPRLEQETAASETVTPSEVVPDSDAALRILQLGKRLRRADLRKRRGRAWVLRASVLSPLRAAREAWRGLKEYGDIAATHSGVSRVSQFCWGWWLNWRFDYDADTVYRFQLYHRARAWPLPRFIAWSEAAMLYRSIAPLAGERAATTLADKRMFAEWCSAHGIATPPVYMEFDKGSCTRNAVAGREEIARCDLFAKWATQYGGTWTAAWHYDGNGFVDGEGNRATLPDIVRQLEDKSMSGPVVLQPRLRNHPELQRITSNALSTIRVMTMRPPDGAAELLVAVLRMGTGHSTADNFAQGGIGSPIDPVTGEIGEARRVDKQHRTYVYNTHPDTGATIPHLRIPYWEESVALAIDAHNSLGEIACVGWDVAVLPDGPVLLEGNWNPCTKLVQVVTQQPLLTSRFATVHVQWLDSPQCSFDDDWLLQQQTWSPVQ